MWLLSYTPGKAEVTFTLQSTAQCEHARVERWCNSHMHCSVPKKNPICSFLNLLISALSKDNVPALTFHLYIFCFFSFAAGSSLLSFPSHLSRCSTTAPCPPKHPPSVALCTQPLCHYSRWGWHPTQRHRHPHRPSSHSRQRLSPLWNGHTRWWRS